MAALGIGAFIVALIVVAIVALVLLMRASLNATWLVIGGGMVGAIAKLLPLGS